MNHHVLICLTRYLLALAAGVGLSYAFTPTDYGTIAWFFPAVLVALIWSIPQAERMWKKDWGRGFRIAFVAGFGFWVRDVAFIGAVSQQGGWASSGGLALYLSLYFGVYGGWAATLGRWRILPHTKPAFQILLLAVMHGFLWCGLEWVRGLSRMSFGWDGLGVSFIKSGFMMAQSADLIGVNGLSFFMVFGGVVLVQTLRSFHLEALHGYRRAHWEVGVTLLLLCLNFFYGTYRLKQIREVDTMSVKTLLVQQNIPVAECWKDSNFDLYAKALEEAFAKIEDRAVESLQKTGEAKIEMPELVIFPESAFPSPLYASEPKTPITGQPLQLFIDDIVRKYGDFYFITGLVEYPGYIDFRDHIRIQKEGEFYNAMAFFKEGFLSYEMKAKKHLMPFGEYMPLGDLPLFQKAYQYSSGMTFGSSFTPAEVFDPQAVEVNGKKISIIPTVCYEDSISRVVRKYVRNEPQMIANVTNDGWFAGTACAEKHFQNARFRAIEYRRPLARAANTGVSAVVNVAGSTSHPITGEPQELRDESHHAEIAGSLEAVVEIPTQPIFTLYSLIGDVFCWGGGLIALAWSGFQIRRNRSGRGVISAE